MITGFIPAGGQGSRLNPHTDEVPKPMLLMGGSDRRLIDVPLGALRESCEDVFVTTHFNPEALEGYLSSHTGLRVLRDERVLGNAGSFVEHYQALSELDPNGSILIMPGDHVFDNLSIDDFFEQHRERDADITLLVVPPKTYGEYVMVEDGFATGLTRDASQPVFSTTGIYMVKNDFVLDWALHLRQQDWDGEPKNITADLINPAIEHGNVAVFHLPTDGYWDDAGTFGRYHQNNMRLSGGENIVSTEADIDGARLTRCVVLGGVALGTSVELENAIVSSSRSGLRITWV